MRAVVQRVSRAAVSVDGHTVGSIGLGLLVLLGISSDDTPADADALAAKLARLRIFRDQEGRMNRSVLDVEGSVLLVSQFTLYGDTRRGNRPSFTNAADPAQAAPLVDEVVERLAAEGLIVATGEFGAMMDVQLVNDGPVTLIVEAQGGRIR